MQGEVETVEIEACTGQQDACKETVDIEDHTGQQKASNIYKVWTQWELLIQEH